jgi:hypothetical protein
MIDLKTGLWGNPMPAKLIPIKESPGPYKGTVNERQRITMWTKLKTKIYEWYAKYWDVL